MISKDKIKQQINVFESREQLGQKAAKDIEKKIIELLAQKQEIRIIFAAAPSQNELLQQLVAAKGIEWNRIIAFHMDEYIGLPAAAPQLFANFLSEKLFNILPFKKIHLINGNNAQKECERYEKLIQAAPIDIICLGIGENGHIAFNDPPVADFNDPQTIKKVELDQTCRQQQVNDGCFKSIDAVPKLAYTLTIPTLMNGHALFCVVPGKTKKTAVHQTLHFREISTQWPSTILRNHPNCKFYFDTDSYENLKS
ncbi:MAG: glucosamine-6-phosphate deaminase [Ulvibacter sp.]|jgi:glucosamine-6-phosphate deaminase